MTAAYDNNIIYKLVSALGITDKNSKTCHIVVYQQYGYTQNVCNIILIYYNIIVTLRCSYFYTQAHGLTVILFPILFYYFLLQVYANRQTAAVQLVSVIKNSRAV